MSTLLKQIQTPNNENRFFFLNLRKKISGQFQLLLYTHKQHYYFFCSISKKRKYRISVWTPLGTPFWPV